MKICDFSKDHFTASLPCSSRFTFCKTSWRSFHSSKVNPCRLLPSWMSQSPFPNVNPVRPNVNPFNMQMHPSFYYVILRFRHCRIKQNVMSCYFWNWLPCFWMTFMVYSYDSFSSMILLYISPLLFATVYSPPMAHKVFFHSILIVHF